MLALALALCLLLLKVSYMNKWWESSSGGVEVVNINDEIEKSVNARVIAAVTLTYETSGVPTVNITNIDVHNGKFTAYGRVYVTDYYGDPYSGRFDAEGTVQDDGWVNIKDFNLETPTSCK